MNEEIVAKAAAIVESKAGGENKGYCTLALIDTDGYPSVTTISVAKADGIKWVTFCTGLGSKSDRINHSNKAAVCFNSEDYHIALTGTIKELTDPEIKKEMWYSGMGEHFSGYNDPAYCVLKFTTERYNLLVDWQSVRGTL